jgi:threonine dehydrogenase-like Zn-dependent dehydrogenase
MRGVIAEAGKVRLTELENPSPNQLFIKVAESGICGSDLHMVENGMAPVAIGHEFGGYLPDGSLVAVRPTGECGECDSCRRGFQNACKLTWTSSYGIAQNGGLADFVVVDEQRVYPMLESARPEDAALVEPLAVCWHGVRRANPEKGSRALVVGAGSIGLLTVAALREWGVEVDIVSRHAHQSAAAEALGAHVIDKPKAVSYMTTFDAVCNQETFDMCATAAMPGGVLLELGMFWTPVQMSNTFMFKEITFIPSITYTHSNTHDDFRESADALAKNHGIADAVITHTFPLDDAVEAFRVAGDRASGAIKVHLRP